MQHIHVLVLIQDPRDWPGPMWKRMQRQRAAASERNRCVQAGRSLPSTYVEEGESTRNLVPSHRSEA